MVRDTARLLDASPSPKDTDDKPETSESQVPTDIFEHGLSIKHLVENACFGSYTLEATSGLSPLGRLLFSDAVKHQRPFIPEKEYFPVTGHSPLHTTFRQKTVGWLITNIGILGERSVPCDRKFGPGSFVRIHDTSLSMRGFGFEKPWLFAVIGEGRFREEGFHIFTAKRHLCVYTGTPYPIDTDDVIIIIPNIFVRPDAQLLDGERMRSLGQRTYDDYPFAYPPLRPWEDNPIWMHPEWYKVDQWRKGELPNFPAVWSRYLGMQ
jgi:hypothetical protein